MQNRIFFTLFFALFTAITGVGMVVPLLPVYAKELGASEFLIGMVFGAFSLSRSMLLPFFGKASDHYGRKPFITAGLFGYGLIACAFMISKSVESVIFVRFLHGASSAMILPVVNAYVAEITPPGREGRMMGLFNLSLFASLTLGPILGGLIHDSMGMNSSFVFMAVLSFLGCSMAIALLPPVKEESRAGRSQNPVPFLKLVADRLVGALGLFQLSYCIGLGVMWSFLPLYAAEHYHLTSFRSGLLITIPVVVTGVLQPFMGALADRGDKRVLVAVGGILVEAAMLLYFFADGFWWLALASLVFGLGGGAAEPALMALAVKEGKRTQSMASVMGVVTLGHSLGMFVGSFVGGIVAQVFSLPWSFISGSVLMGLGTAGFLALYSARQGQDEEAKQDA